MRILSQQDCRHFQGNRKFCQVSHDDFRILCNSNNIFIRNIIRKRVLQLNLLIYSKRFAQKNPQSLWKIQPWWTSLFFKSLHCFITGDTSPLHLCGALGIPSVALFLGGASPTGSGILQDREIHIELILNKNGQISSQEAFEALKNGKFKRE